LFFRGPSFSGFANSTPLLHNFNTNVRTQAALNLPFELQICTPVAPVMANVHIHFGFVRLLVFQLVAREGQTDRHTNRHICNAGY